MTDDKTSLSAYQRGNRHFVAREFGEAIKAFSEHASTHPGDAADCFERLGACYLRTNVVTTPRPLAGDAIRLVSMGNMELAEHHLRRALELEPDHFAALLSLSELPQLSEGERVDLRERAVAIQPHYLTLCELGDYYRSKVKDLARAMALYERAHETDPRDSAAYEKLADVCRRSGKPEEAKAWRAKLKAMKAKPSTRQP